MKYLKFQLKRPMTLCLLSALSLVSGAGNPAMLAQSTPTPIQTQSSSSAVPSPSTQDAQQQNNNPVGTAAAPAVDPQGVPGSRPSGAAIAAGKQKHRHSFAVRTALVVAAVVAVGTVVGLSEASPSHSH